MVTAETAGGASVYHVTKERHGQTITLAQGQTLAVVLPNKVGSARRWTPEPMDANVLVRSSGTQTIGPRTKGGMIGGAPWPRDASSSGVGPGTTPLTMTLQKNPRDGGGRTVFRINVVVRGAAN